MKKLGRTGSTFATVVAAAAVIAVATTGGAVAGGLITSKQIKDNTIKSVDVKDGKLQGVDVKDGSLTGTDVANGTLTKDDFAPGANGIVRAYVYSGSASPTIGTPEALSGVYVYNGAGGAVTRTRTAVGHYSLTFSGLDLNAGNVQVTGYGPGDAIFCKVAAWAVSTANVECYDAAGAAADSRFTMAFIR